MVLVVVVIVVFFFGKLISFVFFGFVGIDWYL